MVFAFLLLFNIALAIHISFTSIPWYLGALYGFLSYLGLSFISAILFMGISLVLYKTCPKVLRYKERYIIIGENEKYYNAEECNFRKSIITETRFIPANETPYIEVEHYNIKRILRILFCEIEDDDIHIILYKTED